MKKSQLQGNSMLPSHIQLSLPLFQSSKPFLDFKKKVRGKNRQSFNQLENLVTDFEIALSRDEIKSVEARFAIRQFLSFVKGVSKN